MARKKVHRLEHLDQKLIWHPFTQMAEWEKETPLVIARGEGNYLFDIHGKKYLDGGSSLWVNLHGHRKSDIDRAVKNQIDRVAHSTLLGLGNTPSIELAERLIKIVPDGLSRVFYSDNGSTAVEVALKMAFQYWQQTPTPHARKRTKFVAFTGAYHGDTFGAMSVGEIDIFVKKYRRLLFNTFRAPYPYCYRCPVKKSYPDCGIACIREFEEIVRRHYREIAACIIEPMVQGAAGMIVAPPGFLKKVERICRRYKILLIADEVATGFGRTGKMFACEHEGVRPDILCLAKGITGGYLPLAATLTTEKVYRAFLGRYDDFRAFFHGHTYTGNQLGCAAAVASLDIFRKEKTLRKIAPKIRLFSTLIKNIGELQHVGDVRQIGLIAGIELVKHRKKKRPYPPEERMGHRVCMAARQDGLIIRPIGDVIILTPPLSIKEFELKRMIAIVHRCIERLTNV
ncbi:MAG: adenosylmethionine--8-amino-7-oxononanoate transaminase [Thermodesulfobacteriota bacterium]